MIVLESLPANQLRLGQEAVLTRTLNEEDIALFAALSGDCNPAHLDHVYAEASPFRGVIAHGLWGGSLISAVIGMKLPGPGTIYLSQSLKFTRPIRPGDAVEARVRVAGLDAARGRVMLACDVTANGEGAIAGEAEVLAPRTAQRREVESGFEAVLIERPTRFRALIKTATGHPPLIARLEGGQNASAGIARAEAEGLVRHDDTASLRVADRIDRPGQTGVIVLDAPAAKALIAIVWGAPAAWASAARALDLDAAHRARLTADAMKCAATGDAPLLIAPGADQALLFADALDHLGGAAAFAWHDPGASLSTLVGDDPDGLEITAGLALASLTRTLALA
ncbi:MAG: MaoC family dehydratase [Pseudomonadota bacterium]